MQTFMPCPDFADSLICLDNKRLGKQRVETWQILQTLRRGKGPWYNHPAVQMWKGYEEALIKYYNANLIVWEGRGYQNKKLVFLSEKAGYIQYPKWFGDPAFHASHRSNLLRKDPAWYGKFGWVESPDMEYVWPILN